MQLFFNSLEILKSANSLLSNKINFLGLKFEICLLNSLPILPPAPVTNIIFLLNSTSLLVSLTFCFLPKTSSIMIGDVSKVFLDKARLETLLICPIANPFFFANIAS